MEKTDRQDEGRRKKDDDEECLHLKKKDKPLQKDAASANEKKMLNIQLYDNEY